MNTNNLLLPKQTIFKLTLKAFAYYTCLLQFCFLWPAQQRINILRSNHTLFRHLKCAACCTGEKNVADRETPAPEGSMAETDVS